MKHKQLLLTIKDLKDLGLLKKKSKRKMKYKKKVRTTNNIVPGIKSDSSHFKIGTNTLTDKKSFGTQINRANDLHNESIRLQNEKLLENIKHGENYNKAFLALKNDQNETKENLQNFKQQAAQYADYLQKTILYRPTSDDAPNKAPSGGLPFNDDAVDVAPSGGSEYFDVMGDPNKLVDHHPNENESMYKSDKKLSPSSSDLSLESPPVKAEPKVRNVSQMNTEQLSQKYLDLGGTSDISALTRKEKYMMIKQLMNTLKPPKKVYQSKKNK